MSCLQKEVVAPMPRIILLLRVHIGHKGHQLSLEMNGLNCKVMEEGPLWVPVVCQMIKLVKINHTFCPSSVRGRCCNPSNYFAAAWLYFSQRPSFVTNDEWRQID
jgi:hypothetical protein